MEAQTLAKKYKLVTTVRPYQNANRPEKTILEWSLEAFQGALAAILKAGDVEAYSAFGGLTTEAFLHLKRTGAGGNVGRMKARNLDNEYAVLMGLIEDSKSLFAPVRVRHFEEQTNEARRALAQQWQDTENAAQALVDQLQRVIEYQASLREAEGHLESAEAAAGETPKPKTALQAPWGLSYTGDTASLAEMSSHLLYWVLRGRPIRLRRDELQHV